MNEFLQWVYLIYFLTHIPITLLVDLQAVFGQHYPLYLQDIITWYVATFKDHLMRDPPVWFQSFIMAELVFQLPFFLRRFIWLLSQGELDSNTVDNIWDPCCDYCFADIERDPRKHA